MGLGEEDLDKATWACCLMVSCSRIPVPGSGWLAVDGGEVDRVAESAGDVPNHAVSTVVDCDWSDSDGWRLTVMAPWPK